MGWLILPQFSVDVLLQQSSAVLTKISKLLRDCPPGPFALPGVNGRSIKLTESNTLLALWPSSSSQCVDMAAAALLAVSLDCGAAVELEDDDFSDVIERACRLADCVWNSRAFPDAWHMHKVNEVNTVFACNRSIQDLRIAYRTSTRANHRVVEIGSIFMAYCRQDSVRVPLLEDETLAAIPTRLEPPTSAEIAKTIEKPNATEPPWATRDLVIAAPERDESLYSRQYSDWMNENGPLTRQQRRVISHRVERPLRIHGPAGSGKTLVLILKALRLLREAEEKGERCHILLVANSNAVRDTIRRAIEVIDDRGYLATTKKDSIYFDLETLHGWCIRELGLEPGNRYIIDSDPVISRENQRKLLDDAIASVMQTRFNNLRYLGLSRDLIARIEVDSEQFARDMAAEISIRIKARGYRRSDIDRYAKSEATSFIGRAENEFDRRLLFHIYEGYESRLESKGLLDTDDIVLSMSARLTTALWGRQRSLTGYDYVFVDETHLFNENEKRALPPLTRGNMAHLPLVMTFDESQSIGGKRGRLEDVGISNSEQRKLNYVHRCSPEILGLARRLVEQSAMVFDEHATNSDMISRMTESQKARCKSPSIVFAKGEHSVPVIAARTCVQLRSANYHRVGVVVFHSRLVGEVLNALNQVDSNVVYVRERGEPLAAIARSGTYVMTPESCGGLEFDAVILVGADEGRFPPSISDLAPQAYLSLEEDAYRQLYTSITRARYRLVFICDADRNITSLLKNCVRDGLTGC